jgi:hypothetical protein
VARTVARTSVSKRHRKNATRKGRPSTTIVTDLLVVLRMPQSKPAPTGPMRTQPTERGSTMPTQVQPMMPSMGKAAKTPQPKQQPTRTEAVRAAKARLMRLNSLRKQRDAQKG